MISFGDVTLNTCILWYYKDVRNKPRCRVCWECWSNGTLCGFSWYWDLTGQNIFSLFSTRHMHRFHMMLLHLHMLPRLCTLLMASPTLLLIHINIQVNTYFIWIKAYRMNLSQRIYSSIHTHIINNCSIKAVETLTSNNGIHQLWYQCCGNDPKR